MFRPHPLVEVALVRTAQWGGRGRRQSLGSFVDLLIGRDVNADTPAEEPNDPANEMAGYDLRVACGGGLRCAGYTQLIGEDLAGGWPSRYLGLYGAEASSADGRWRGFVEVAETGCKMPIGQRVLPNCAYRNYAYPGGYVDGGRWLGSAWGPDARVLTLGAIDTATDGTLKLHYGRLSGGIGRFGGGPDPAAAGHLLGAAWRRAWQLGPWRIAPEAAWFRWRTPTGTHVAPRVGVAVDYGFDAPVAR